MNASLNEKLRAVKWGEYKLGTLFDIENTLSFNAEKLVDGTKYDYVTRTSINQGILQTTGFVNESNINASGTWSLGLLSMDFFYRRKPWYAGQFVRKIIPNISIPEKAVPFFSTILNKQKPILLSVLVRSVDETFKNISIKLPEIADGEIDFDFMESFIAELEAERVAELSAYLTVSGLDNYELSNDEEDALKNFQSLKWDTYNLEKLFGKATRGKRLKGDDRMQVRFRLSLPAKHQKAFLHISATRSRCSRRTLQRLICSVLLSIVITSTEQTIMWQLYILKPFQ